MLKKFLLNISRPRGIGGAIILLTMNIAHSGLSVWGLRNLEIKRGNRILDVGCGGGRNIARMLKLASEGMVCGLDYSEVSVAKSVKINRKAVASGRSEIRAGSISKIPWADGGFDIVTAFETVYFWPDFVNDLREVRRILKQGGTLFICNESVKPDDGESPYQTFVKMLDLKIYSQRDFTLALSEAGFIDIKFVTKGSWICVLALK
jgi:SAM-dependent methyltransferase